MKQYGTLVGEMILTGKNRSTRRNPVTVPFFVYKKNPKRFDLRMNPGLLDNRPVTDSPLSNDTVRPSWLQVHFTRTSSVLVTACSRNWHTRQIAERREGTLNYALTVKFGFRKRNSEARCRCAPVPRLIMPLVPPLNSVLYLGDATSNSSCKFGA